MSDGGTLIGIENAAVFLTDTTTKFSKVRQKRQVLKNLIMYEDAYQREKIAGESKIDSVAVWEGKNSPKPDAKDPQKGKVDIKKIKELDERQRLFRSYGTIVRVNIDQEHWMGFGVGPRVPALLNSPYALVSKRPVQTAARLGEAPNLRLSGLLWPEARSRWEKVSYATRESLGNGQIILFAADPNFRSYYYGTSRMLLNSILLGPGFGTRPVVEM